MDGTMTVLPHHDRSAMTVLPSHDLHSHDLFIRINATDVQKRTPITLFRSTPNSVKRRSDGGIRTRRSAKKTVERVNSRDKAAESARWYANPGLRLAVGSVKRKGKST